MASVTLDESIKREIGQHFVFGFHGHEISDDITTLIREYHLGNVILMKRNIESTVQCRRITDALQKLAHECGHTHPLLIGIDQENGLVSGFSVPSGAAGTQFPGAMALAATGSPEITERVYRASAEELRAGGINWAYSPVADVNSDARNPVIGVRAFGDDPHAVAAFATAAARGLEAGRVIACAKHFPGHGDTHVDSHLALPVIPKSRAELAATELVPFRALAAARIPSIMTGHMALPALTGDSTPASLARAATHGLLRDELGYEGVIVTDCLEMDAVAAAYGAEGGAVRALQAGADVVMICHRMVRHVGALEATYAAVAAGELSLDELRAGGRRIAALKERYCGAWADVLGAPPPDTAALATQKAAHLALAQAAYTASTALVRDPHNALPLPASRVVLFTPVLVSLNLAVDDAEGVLRTADGPIRNTAGPSFLSFAAAIAARCAAAPQHVVYAPGDVAPAWDAAQTDAVVFALRSADRGAWQLEALKAVMARMQPCTKLAVVATCTPYDLLDAAAAGLQGVEEWPYVATFEYTKPALEQAAAVLFSPDGRAQAKGRVPVLGGNV